MYDVFSLIFVAVYIWFDYLFFNVFDVIYSTCLTWYQHFVGYQIRNTFTVIFDLNVICTLVNYVAQNTILVLKIQRSIEDYHSSLDWITFAAAMIALIGAVSSLHKCKNRTHKGIWFNVLVSLLLVVASGHALAVHSDPKVWGLWANVLSILLLL